MEEETTIRNKLKKLALSVARQFYCFCSVMLFPVYTIIYDTISTDIAATVKDGTNLVEKEQEEFIVFVRDSSIFSVIGLAIGGTLLRLIGRKYTVIVANLLHLGLLLYSYLYGIENYYPYKMSMIHSLLKEIGHVAFYIYLAEITSPKFRAFFMGLYYFYQASIDEEISAALDERRMNRMLRNCAVLATFTSVFAVFVPETPFWLALKSKSDKAEEIFTWIRAGNSGRSEFNQMLTQAKNIQSKGVMKFIKSRTFAIAMIFTSFIVICAFNPCSVIEVIFNDSYFPEGSTPNEEQMSELNEVMKAPANYLKRNEFYGRLIFLIVQFAVPRKVILFVSYILGVLIISAIKLTIGHADAYLLSLFLSCCSLTPNLGMTPLLMILSVELYPTALREIGVASTAILFLVSRYLSKIFYERAQDGIPREFVDREWNFFIFFASLIGMPFLLLFMPETKDINMYELNELKLSLTSRTPGEGAKGERTAAGLKT